MIRWGADLARVEGVVDGGSAGGGSTIEVALLREGSGGQRKRIRVNGVPRRSPSLAGTLRVVLFAPEEMLLIAGSPGLRRAALDSLAGGRSPAYPADLATYGRALQQRNSLLRAIREEQASRDQLPLLGQRPARFRGGGRCRPARRSWRRLPSLSGPPIARSPRRRAT